MFCMLMATFKQTLEELFPEKVNNIAKRYMSIGRNIFINHLFHELVASIPALEEALNGDPGNPQQALSWDSGNKGMNDLFESAIDKSVFYKHAKRGALTDEEAKDLNNTALFEYYRKCKEFNLLPEPNYVIFENNILYLSSNHINVEHAMAIRQYLEMTKALPEKRVHKFIVDQCQITDEALAEIL